MKRKAFMAIACIALTGCLFGCAFNHVYRAGRGFVRIWSGVIVARDLIGVDEEVEAQAQRDGSAERGSEVTPAGDGECEAGLAKLAK